MCLRTAAPGPAPLSSATAVPYRSTLRIVSGEGWLGETPGAWMSNPGTLIESALWRGGISPAFWISSGQLANALTSARRPSQVPIQPAASARSNTTGWPLWTDTVKKVAWGSRAVTIAPRSLGLTEPNFSFVRSNWAEMARSVGETAPGATPEPLRLFQRFRRKVEGPLPGNEPAFVDGRERPFLIPWATLLAW
jgi:hypothetical protein